MLVLFRLCEVFSDLALHDSRSCEARPYPGWSLYVSRSISPSVDDGVLTSHQLGICHFLGLRALHPKGKAQVWLDFPGKFPVGVNLKIRGFYGSNRQFYVGCRWCTLAALTVQLVGFDSSHGINCQVRSLSLSGKEWVAELAIRFWSL